MRGLTGFRMCIACREYGRQGEMLRIMKSGHTLILSPGRKEFGRSAYLCKASGCVENALKRNLLKKHLKCDLPEGFEDALREAVRES